MAISEVVQLLVDLKIDAKDYEKVLRKIENEQKKRERQDEAFYQKALKREMDRHRAAEASQKRIADAVERANQRQSQSIAKLAATFFTLEKAVSFVKQSIQKFIAQGDGMGEHADAVRQAAQAWDDMQLAVGRFLTTIGDSVLVKALTGVAWAIRDVTDAATGFDRVTANTRESFEEFREVMVEATSGTIAKFNEAIKTTSERAEYLRDELAKLAGDDLTRKQMDRKIQLQEELNKRIDDEVDLRRRLSIVTRNEQMDALFSLKDALDAAGKAAQEAYVQQEKQRAQARASRRGPAAAIPDPFGLRGSQLGAAVGTATAAAERERQNVLRLAGEAAPAISLQDVGNIALGVDKVTESVSEMNRTLRESAQDIFPGFADAASDAFGQLVSGQASAADAARMAIARVLDGLATEFLVRAAAAFASQNYAAAAGWTAAAGLAKAGAAKLGASSGASAGSGVPSGGGSIGGSGGNSSRNITVILGSQFGDEPVRVRRQRVLRAIREAETLPEADVFENR